MSRKFFNEQEILELKANRYVENVSYRTVTFTKEFKRMAYESLTQGVSMCDIFERCGINTGALGKIRVRGYQQRIEEEAQRPSGVETIPTNQQKRKKSYEQDLEKRVKQLENRLAYSMQEVEFLKKIQQADMEARKQWETKHRQK